MANDQTQTSNHKKVVRIRQRLLHIDEMLEAYEKEMIEIDEEIDRLLAENKQLESEESER